MPRISQYYYSDKDIGGDHRNGVAAASTPPPKRPVVVAPRVPRCPINLTTFEQDAVLSLLCRGVHRKEGGAVEFTWALNEALNPRGGSGRRKNKTNKGGNGNGNGNGNGAKYRNIEVCHVDRLLRWLERHQPATMAFIDNQRVAVINRPALRVFRRSMLVGRCGMPQLGP